MRRRWAVVAGGAVLMAAVAGVGLLNRAQPPSSPAAGSPLAPGVAGPAGPVDGGWRVSRVVDGDTVRVRRNGQELKVRLIGIDSPESVKPDTPVECYALEASQFAQDRLEGAAVALEGDPSQQPADRYGRTLAYLWLVDDSGRALSMFNIEAIAAGAAREATYDGAYQWQSAFRAAEESARAQGRGLWAACE